HPLTPTPTGTCPPMNTPASTRAAAEDPRPTPTGIRLRTKPCIGSAESRLGDALSVSAPSPSKVHRGRSAGSASISSQRSTAIASTSKPGPRLAIEAGTLTCMPLDRSLEPDGAPAVAHALLVEGRRGGTVGEAGDEEQRGSAATAPLLGGAHQGLADASSPRRLGHRQGIDVEPGAA